MYVSLIYLFNIIQHILSHIVEHRKLDSLTTPENIVWSTMTSCWTSWGQIDEHCWSNNVGWQKLNHLTSHLNNVETCVINMIIQILYFGFCQTLNISAQQMCAWWR